MKNGKFSMFTVGFAVSVCTQQFIQGVVGKEDYLLVLDKTWAPGPPALWLFLAFLVFICDQLGHRDLLNRINGRLGIKTVEDAVAEQNGIQRRELNHGFFESNDALMYRIVRKVAQEQVLKEVVDNAVVKGRVDV